MTALRLAVRQLALAIHQNGDLYPSAEGPSVDARLGVKAQQALQQQRRQQDDTYVAEHSVRLQREWHAVDSCLPAVSLTLSGRIDGLSRSATGPQVEEIKCVGRLPEAPKSIGQHT